MMVDLVATIIVGAFVGEVIALLLWWLIVKRPRRKPPVPGRIKGRKYLW